MESLHFVLWNKKIICIYYLLDIFYVKIMFKVLCCWSERVIHSYKKLQGVMNNSIVITLCFTILCPSLLAPCVSPFLSDICVGPAFWWFSVARPYYNLKTFLYDLQTTSTRVRKENTTNTIYSEYTTRLKKIRLSQPLYHVCRN